MLVGGYAVNVHGYIRATNDMDLWIKPTNENKLLLIEVLQRKGFDNEGLKLIEQQNFEETFVFHIWQKPLRVDFITRVKGVSLKKQMLKKYYYR